MRMRWKRPTEEELRNMSPDERERLASEAEFYGDDADYLFWSSDQGNWLRREADRIRNFGAQKAREDILDWAQEDREWSREQAELSRKRQDEMWEMQKQQADEAREWRQWQKQREIRRERQMDKQREQSMSMLQSIQDRRNQLIQDIRDAPSSVMQQARRNYDMQLQNKIAMAGSGGVGFGRTAGQSVSDSMSVADANLMGSSASAFAQENMARKGVEAGLLGQQADTAMRQFALSRGEGNSYLPAMDAHGRAMSGLLGISGQGLNFMGQMQQSSQWGMGSGMAQYNADRQFQLEREKIQMQRNLGILAMIGGGLQAGAKAFGAD